MTGLNVEWAVRRLDEFIEKPRPGRSRGAEFLLSSLLGPDFVRITDFYVPEQIIKQVQPDQKVSGLSDLNLQREVAIRVRAHLQRQEELCENLGDNSPEISASKLHSWIWEGASSLWQSGHYREAVEAAIKKLNAETQNKLGRRDVSEKALFDQAFGEQDPELGKPRLHRMENDGSSTFKSVQRGARFFAEGVFAGIRNPLAHESEQDMPEQQALEYLAALSVLARWVDESMVVKAEP